MKILFVDHFEDDYMAALLYWGLYLEFGADDTRGSFVVDWPWKGAYHGHYDRVVSWSGPPWKWVPVLPAREWTDDEVYRRIREFDLVVLASPRATNTAKIRELIERVGGRDKLPRFVMVDGEDYSDVHWNIVEWARPSVYMKCSLIARPHENWLHEKEKGADKLTRLVPFPHACPVIKASPVAKDIDVCFLGGNHWRGFGRGPGVPIDPEARPSLERRLAAEFGKPGLYLDKGMALHEQEQATPPGRPIGYLSGHTHYWHLYVRLVNRAKLAVVVGGAGYEPIRTYEALQCPGTMVLREDVGQIIPPAMELKDGVNCAVFHSTDELVEMAMYYLASEGERTRVAAAGNALGREHHTPRALARRLLTEAFR